MLSEITTNFMYLLAGTILAILSIVVILSRFFNNMLKKLVEDTVEEKLDVVNVGLKEELQEFKIDIKSDLIEKLVNLDKKFDIRLSELSRKITVNGKNTPNIGDSVARSEEKIDILLKSVDKIDEKLIDVALKMTDHIGWHSGRGDFKTHV